MFPFSNSFRGGRDKPLSTRGAGRGFRSASGLFEDRSRNSVSASPAQGDRPGPTGRGGRGHRGGGGGGGGGHGGGRGQRMFEHGALKLLVLNLLAEQPRLGYEVIKAIEQLVGGDYSPSPGVIYPTLTYLTDVGWAVAEERDGGRKQYTITAEGRAQVEGQKEAIDQVLGRLTLTRREAGARGAPEIQRAMSNLKTALQMRFAQGEPDRKLIQAVAELIDQAAVAIERL